MNWRPATGLDTAFRATQVVGTGAMCGAVGSGAVDMLAGFQTPDVDTDVDSSDN
jgi:hypothetical protein